MNPHRAYLGVYGISYRYGSRQVLDEVSFELEEGEFLSLLGPNGSGKSTLLRAIAGVLRLPASSGQVRLKGEEFLSQSPRYRARNVAYVASDLRAEFPVTAGEAVWMGRICRDPAVPGKVTASEDEIVRHAMEICLCWNLRGRMLSTLSGGERQLVALARAIAQGPKVLLIDEALSRMDLNHQAEIGKMLKAQTKEGRAVILVSHDLNIATEWADSLLLLKAGKVLKRGKLAEVLTADTVGALYPGAELSVAPSPTTKAPKVFFGPRN